MAIAERLRSERHTVKRALTDPTLFDGIGNAYSDEILHRAALSPVQLTRSTSDAVVTLLTELDAHIYTFSEVNRVLGVLAHLVSTDT